MFKIDKIMFPKKSVVKSNFDSDKLLFCIFLGLAITFLHANRPVRHKTLGSIVGCTQIGDGSTGQHLVT